MNMKKVNILLSTYNGEKYLEEQLNSLVNQIDVELDILVRDDGSKDATLNIIQQYMQKYNYIHLYKGKNLGPTFSFLDLLQNSHEADYYAFCDQDDVWDTDKMIKAVEAMESDNEKEIPQLYYCEMRVTDEKRNFLYFVQKTRPKQKNKYTSLLENAASGCSMVFNKVARDLLCMKQPEYCSMHDAWVFMVCSMFGKVYYDPNPHMDYRQHTNNVAGAGKEGGLHYNLKMIMERMRQKERQPRYLNAINFEKCYGELLNEEDRKKLKKITNYKKSFISKLILLFDTEIGIADWKFDLTYRVLIILGIA